MGVGTASIVRKANTVADVNGYAIIIAEDTVPVGCQLSISDVQFSVVTNKDIFYLESPSGTPIAAWSSEKEIDSLSHCTTRHYNTPIVIDGLLAAQTYRMRVWGSAGAQNAYAGILAELADYNHHTAMVYEGQLTFVPTVWTNIGAAYTVPTGRKLSITDIDFSTRIVTASGAPYVLRVNVNAVPQYYVELMLQGGQFVSLECPIEATAGQIVQMQAISAADANPDTAWAQWVGQLI